MTEAAYDALCADLDSALETGYMATIGTAERDGEILLCIREVIAIREGAYVERAGDHLVISSVGFVPALGQAARADASAAFIHTHPGVDPRHSELDDGVDDALAPVAMLRTSTPTYLSIVVGGSPSEPRFAGKVVNAVGPAVRVESFRVVGERIRLIPAGDRPESPVESEPFDRQIRAFGEAGQRALANVRVGIAGAGGTGSAVAEQLARLGVGEVVIVDDDLVTDSNVSRIYGSTSSDVGRPKVDVLADYLRRIRPDVRVTPIVGRVTREKVARTLRFCDVLFGCTDDQWGRSVLARLAYWYLIPLLDLAVVITSNAGQVEEIIGRLTYVGPGSACLLCRGRLHPDAIRAETLPKAERERLASEGYVQGLGDPDPSVVTYTTLIAAMGTSELLQRLFGFAHGPYADELLYRADRQELRRNRVAPRPGHYCASPSEWGRADTEPFLGQLWT